MKTTEERLAAIEAELAEIPRRGKWVSSFEESLREAALQYARVKDHGWYLENGERRRVDRNEMTSFLDLFSNRMKMHAVDLLSELGLETPRK